MQGIYSLISIFFRMFLARPAPGVVILVGMFSVTAIVVSLFVIGDAFERALTATGQPDRALLLRAGSTSEINGNVRLEQHGIVRDMPQVKREGVLNLASRETFVTVRLPTLRSEDEEATVPLRGVEAIAFEVRPEVSVVEGVTFSPGKYELLVGVKAARTFKDLDIGSTIQIRGQQYLVTGHFTANGTASESELWMDERLLAQTLNRGETFSSLLVRLESSDSFTEFAKLVGEDRRLTLSTYRESEYYEDLSSTTTGLMNGLGIIVGVIMSLGAIAAAMTSMQAALQSRTRELATLRAIGFGKRTILVAVLIESMVLALIGALLSIVVVFFALDGDTLSTVAGATTSGAQVGFVFQVQAHAILLAAAIALSLGLVGGLIPGIAMMRQSLVASLRS